jgi:uncharacterized protein
MGNFHQGEVVVQAAFAMAESMASIGEKVIRSYMPEQHRDFFSLLPFILVGSVDENLQPTASVLTGFPGFISSPSERFLQIRSLPLAGDPLGKNLQLNSPLGLLGIQPHTKRRNRMNGWVTEKSYGNFLIQVQQSFGNCPKYIVERVLEYSPLQLHGRVFESVELDDLQVKWIEQADTFFMATAHPQALEPKSAEQGVDLSHRGGIPGFISANRKSLKFPDYKGNFFFNSFGNLHLNPKAGLIFFDFERKSILQLEVNVHSTLANKMEMDRGIQAWCECDVTGVRMYTHAIELKLIAKG